MSNDDLTTKLAEPRKPLTREQVQEIVREAGYHGGAIQARADFINGLRHGEQAHGIKEQQ